MFSPLRPILATMALACVVALPVAGQETTVQFAGLTADTSQPIEVQSDALSINQTDGYAVFSGSVMVTQGELHLSAAEIRVEYGKDGKSIETLYASGEVLITNATDSAKADAAVYTVSTADVLMTGNVFLTQGQSTISAQSMVVNLETGTGRLSGRVTTTFAPSKN